MVSTTTPPGEIGCEAAGFSLPDPDGKRWTLDDVKGDNGLVVAFICNHCPYVKAIIDRFVEDARALQDRDIGVVAIMPNDWSVYPDDAPDRMKEFAARHGFTFPYLVDETQDVARAYGAVCTPDVFGFGRDMTLKYRGRIDCAGRTACPPDARRELVEAMIHVAETNEAPEEQNASIGCSIKWRA